MSQKTFVAVRITAVVLLFALVAGIMAFIFTLERRQQYNYPIRIETSTNPTNLTFTMTLSKPVSQTSILYIQEQHGDESVVGPQPITPESGTTFVSSVVTGRYVAYVREGGLDGRVVGMSEPFVVNVWSVYYSVPDPATSVGITVTGNAPGCETVSMIYPQGGGAGPSVTIPEGEDSYSLVVDRPSVRGVRLEFVNRNGYTHRADVDFDDGLV